MSTKTLVSLLLILLGFITVFVLATNSGSEEAVLNEEKQREDLQRSLLEINETDHVYGSRNAKVKLVLYSDTDCQYCRYLYPKLKSLVDEYPEEDLALVYRHIPIYYYRGGIDVSEKVGECVAEELGEKGFYDYIRNLFQRLPQGVETDGVPKTTALESAVAAGASEQFINDCVDRPEIELKISSMHNSGGALGVILIPHTFIVSDDEIFSITRNQSRETFQIIVDEMLR